MTAPTTHLSAVAERASDPASPLERRGALAALVMMGWLTIVLAIDHDGSLATQRVMGALTWLVLLGALRFATPLVRVQALVVVALASVVG